jgi:hypothetical protein
MSRARSRLVNAYKLRRRSFSCLAKTAQFQKKYARLCFGIKLDFLFLSNIEQPGPSLRCYGDCMTIVRHYPETSPEPTESSFPGYPLGVWPPTISSFCKENATYATRHGDCSLPGCTCPCHSRPR